MIDSQAWLDNIAGFGRVRPHHDGATASEFIESTKEKARIPARKSRSSLTASRRRRMPTRTAAAHSLTCSTRRCSAWRTSIWISI